MNSAARRSLALLVERLTLQVSVARREGGGRDSAASAARPANAALQYDKPLSKWIGLRPPSAVAPLVSLDAEEDAYARQERDEDALGEGRHGRDGERIALKHVLVGRRHGDLSHM